MGNRRITIAPVVEGHGEEASIRPLLWRTWVELLNGEHAEVIKPIRQPRGRLLKPSGLERAIDLAALKLQDRTDPTLILVMIDAEKDCLTRQTPLGPELLDRARDHRGDYDISVVIVNVMLETWFVGCAESLRKYLDFDDDEVPADPEVKRAGKGWIKGRFRFSSYSSAVDQARLVDAMDLAVCRSRCRSFDKLCRELEQRKTHPAHGWMRRS